jgi:hypothetical protein
LFNKKRFGVVALMLVLFLLAGCSFGGKETYQVVVRTNPATAGVEVYVGSTEGKRLGVTNEEGLLEIEEELEEGTVLIGVKEGYQVRPEEAKVKGHTVEFYVYEDPGDKAAVIVSVESGRLDYHLGKAPELGQAPKFEELPLPEKVEVTLDNDIPAILEVTWQEGDYDPKKPGVYVIKGDLTLVEGIIENPDGLQAEFEITVTADPVDGIVTTNAQEYTAGDMIEITVELLYKKQQEGEEPKYLVTLNGEYPAQIFIGDRYYSKLLTFTNGVAVTEVRAEKAEDEQEVKVSVEFEAGADWVDMTAEETVKIQAGDAVKLDVTEIDDNDLLGAELVAQDAYGNEVLTYEGTKIIKVTYELKGTGALAAGYEIDPDGQVAVKFSEGRARVLYGGFEFAPDLEAGKDYTFTFTVVEDGLTGTIDYTHNPE